VGVVCAEVRLRLGAGLGGAMRCRACLLHRFASARLRSMDGQIQAIASRYKDQPGPLLLVLHAIQDEWGYLPPAAVPIVAAVLNLSRAEVHGVVSFYQHFRTSPPGRHVLRICRAESCQSMKGTQIEQRARESLGIDFHQTTADGLFSLEPVFCLGLCACSPAIMIDEMLIGRVTPERLDEVIAAKRTDP